MDHTELNKTLVAIGRIPTVFYRDTGLLLQALENLERINAILQKEIVGDNPVKGQNHETIDKE